MIRVSFVAPRSKRWRDWRRRCREFLKPYLGKSKRRPAAVNDTLYKECKDVIFAGYSHKCAYCEGPIEVQSPGDVEHFRPKNRVRDVDNKIVLARDRRKHPGYWWLAYDARNLLPSCIMCNRYTKLWGGKGERFPVLGFRATRPGEERRERPLLIHPGRTDPAGHFELDLSTGGLSGLTEQGRVSIIVYGLNRERLMKARRLAVQDATLALSTPSSRRSPDIQVRIKEQLGGQLLYSFVWRSVRSETARNRPRPSRSRRKKKC